MKKNHFTKSVLVLSGLTLSLLSMAQGPSLADVQCNINIEYPSVTNLVPNMYTFIYDGFSNYISDGGNDMYDGGNYLNTDLAMNINYSDDVIIPDASFGTNGAYFTRELPGFFMLAADLDGVNNFYISGNNGADGTGLASEYVFSSTYAGITYDVYHKNVYGDGDPSINHFIIIPQMSNVTHDFSSDTDNDYQSISGIAGTTRLYYFLVSSLPDVPLTNTEAENIASAFLQAINGGSSLLIVSSATTICEGESVILSAISGNPVAWQNGVVDGVAFTPPLGTNQYTATTVNSNGCNASASISIVVNPVADFTLSSTDALIANDGDIFLTLNNGIFPFSYDWDNDGTGDFDDTQNLMNVAPGTYTVAVMNGNGCISTSSIVVGSQVGLDEMSNETVLVYPNPATSDFTIQYNGSFDYELVDLNGKIVKVGSGEMTEKVSMEDLMTGSYVLQLSGNGQTYNLNLIKK